MAASSGFLIAEAERRFPVRIRIAVPPAGLGGRLDQIKAWLDENTGASHSLLPRPRNPNCDGAVIARNRFAR